MNIGIDAAQIGADSLFNLKTAEKSGQLSKLAAGKKAMVFSEEDRARDTEIHYDEQEANSEDEIDELEAQLDDMYEQYQNRRAERDAKYKAKLARGGDDEAWDGIESGEEEEEGEEKDEEDYEMESLDFDEDDDEHIKLIAEGKQNGELTKTARSFPIRFDIQ